MSRYVRAIGVGIRAGTAAFRKELGSIAPDAMDRDRFALFAARVQRYRLHEALWENTAYDSGPFGVHPWANIWKSRKGLYKYIQGIYNPAYRLIEFHATHVLGGKLDLKAGDGVAVPSALPIETPADAPELRRAIAQLWRSSRWQVKKTVWTRHGAMLGDAPLILRVDQARRKVRFQPIHPKSVVDVCFDDEGNVDGYAIERQVSDPRKTTPLIAGQVPDTVTYCETCERDGDRIVFRTYLNGRPHNWRGVDEHGQELPPEWEVDWTFVPMVWVQHIDAGLDAGVSELHAAIDKIIGVDDTGSKLNDHLRKMVVTKWFFSGMRGTDLTAATVRKKPTEEDPQPGREEELSIAATEPQARAQALVPDLRIAEVCEFLRSRLDVLETDYPELRLHHARVSGDASAKALREIAKPVKTKINERRESYDPQLVRMHQMAIAVGGELGFPGYEGFNLTDFGAPRLEHAVGTRPVFDVEDLDRIEEDQAEATAAKTWADAGVPIEIALERAGWPTELITRVTLLKKADRRAAIAVRDPNPNHEAWD